MIDGLMSPPSLLHLHHLPGGPPPGTLLAKAGTVKPGKSKGLHFHQGTKHTEIFLHAGPEGIEAYLNSCPHAGTPLNLVGDTFTNLAGNMLLCRTHGAMFDPNSGLCLSGPCKGQWLPKIAISDQDGNIYSL